MNEKIIGAAGEFTPHLDARNDFEKYAYGCRHLENMIPRKYGTSTRRPGTVFVTDTIDMDSILSSIVAYENVGVAYGNVVVSTLADTATNNTLMPKFICYEDKIVCYEDNPVVLSETAVLSSLLICNGNNVIFYENETLI